MIDLRELAPAAWGLAGALAYGFYGVIQAFRVPGADVGARRKALFDLALAPVLGPLAASILTSSCLAIAPKFDPRAVEVTLGLIAVPGFPAFLKLALSMIPKPKDGGGA